MDDYVKVFVNEDVIDVAFYIESSKVLAIGVKMNEVNEEAYMNGYNWEAFLNYYLEQNAPELLEDLDCDPEAGMYAAYYPLSAENEKKGQKFGELIAHLIENEEELLQIVREHGDEIEWD